MQDSDPRQTHQLVLFDGHCHLCDGTVDWLLKRDRKGALTFAPLQGTTAAGLRAAGLLPESQDSLIFVRHARPETAAGTVLLHSSAVLAAGSQLGGPWRVLAAVARLVPPPLRDLVYRWIARNRYRWFGRSETCRIPSADERERFLP
ncbi:MAG: thiol-disulfide oxidoreductase DCC family protein [Acidobacteriota bacterium]